MKEGRTAQIARVPVTLVLEYEGRVNIAQLVQALNEEPQEERRMSDERAFRVENIAKFLAFAIDGHDQSWVFVAPEVVEDYRHKAEGLMLCAEGHEWEAVLMGEASSRGSERG